MKRSRISRRASKRNFRNHAIPRLKNLLAVVHHIK
jgi:hypothetical protein